MYRNLIHTRTAATTTTADPEEGQCPLGEDMTIRAFISEGRRHQDIADAITKALTERHGIAWGDRCQIEQQYNNAIRGYEWVVYAVGADGYICPFVYRFTVEA